MPETEEAVAEYRSRTIKEVRVGIVGYGTVGRATAEILAQHAAEIRQRAHGICIRVTRACRRSVSKPDSMPGGVMLVSDWLEVVRADDVDLVIETMGGTDPAYSVIRSSIECGKPVVPANKALIADYGEEL